MSRKAMFVLILVAILAALCSACDDDPCTNCTGEGTVWNTETKTFEQPTPSPVKQVKQFVQQTVQDTSLTFDKEVDRIGLGNTNERINAWTAECLAKGPGYHIRQIDVVTVICEKP